MIMGESGKCWDCLDSEPFPFRLDWPGEGSISSGACCTQPLIRPDKIVVKSYAVLVGSHVATTASHAASNDDWNWRKFGLFVAAVKIGIGRGKNHCLFHIEPIHSWAACDPFEDRACKRWNTGKWRERERGTKQTTREEKIKTKNSCGYADLTQEYILLFFELNPREGFVCRKKPPPIHKRVWISNFRPC